MGNGEWRETFEHMSFEPWWTLKFLMKAQKHMKRPGQITSMPGCLSMTPR